MPQAGQDSTTLLGLARELTRLDRLPGDLALDFLRQRLGSREQMHLLPLSTHAPDDHLPRPEPDGARPLSPPPPAVAGEGGPGPPRRRPNVPEPPCPLLPHSASAA